MNDQSQTPMMGLGHSDKPRTNMSALTATMLFHNAERHKIALDMASIQEETRTMLILEELTQVKTLCLCAREIQALEKWFLLVTDTLTKISGFNDTDGIKFPRKKGFKTAMEREKEQVLQKLSLKVGRKQQLVKLINLVEEGKEQPESLAQAAKAVTTDLEQMFKEWSNLQVSRRLTDVQRASDDTMVSKDYTIVCDHCKATYNRKSSPISQLAIFGIIDGGNVYRTFQSQSAVTHSSIEATATVVNGNGKGIH